MTRLHQLRSQRLVRHFVHSFFDNETIAPGGEIHQTFVTAVALLGGAGCTLALVFAFRYGIALSAAPPATLAWAHIADNLTVLLITMALTGLVTVVAWDGLFPSRRDAHILSALPVPHATLFRARLAASLLLFSLTLAALALLPLLILPPSQTPSGEWTLLARRFLAHALAVSLSSAFVFFSAILAQALLLALLPYHRFLQASSLLQILWLLASFSLFFLTPAPAAALHSSSIQFLPPYWFLHLWQSVAAGLWPFPFHLSTIALAAVAISAAGALALFAAVYQRALRKAVEGVPAAPRGPNPLHRALTALLNNTLLTNPHRRAFFYFSARTLFRHRPHRLVLALYFSLGLAWVLAGLTSSTKLGPNSITCSIPLDFAAVLLIGARALFSLPVDLRANWLFRFNEPAPPNAAPAAARLLMSLIAIVPLALIPLPAIIATWGTRAALLHTLLYLLETAILLEALTLRFRKIPFTCSWLPGQANLKVRLGGFFILFTAMSSFLGALEASLILNRSTKGAIILCTLLAASLAWLILRRRANAREPWALTFEEIPPIQLRTLNLT